MRIALVSEPTGPLHTDRDVHVSSVSRALAAAGHDVIVFTRPDRPDLPSRSDPSSSRADGVTIEHIPPGATTVPADGLLRDLPDFTDALRLRLAEMKPDIVHAHFWTSGLAALAAARDVGRPVLQTFHELGVIRRRHERRRDSATNARIRLEAAIARDAAHVIATSEDEASELVRLGASRAAVTVIPSGVDLTRFRPDGQEAPRSDRPRIVSAGSLDRGAGHETVIRALPAVANAELVIAEGSPVGDEPREPAVRRLTALAEHLGVADRVRFLGVVAREDMPALFRSADAVAHVPAYEPSARVPLEAMACGVPLIASAVGGTPDTVVDGATGILVPPGRPDAVAEALRQLLAEPFWREAYGTAGVDRARSRYSWERIAADTTAVYESVLSGGRPQDDAAMETGATAGAASDTDVEPEPVR